MWPSRWKGATALALLDLASATGTTVAVGNNPIGVATFPRLHTAVVANNGDGSASVVDELSLAVLHTITTGAGSTGVAADQDTGEAAVANGVANTVSIVNVATAGASTLSVGQFPLSVAFNNQNHRNRGGCRLGRFDRIWIWRRLAHQFVLAQRADLDRLRSGAFGLRPVEHAGMFHRQLQHHECGGHHGPHQFVAIGVPSGHQPDGHRL